MWTTRRMCLIALEMRVAMYPVSPLLAAQAPSRRFPFWKGYYQCASMGCGIAALLNFLRGIGPAAFCSACTANLIRCNFGRLWSYDDTPPRT
jgi:hypothetical protein